MGVGTRLVVVDAGEVLSFGGGTPEVIGQVTPHAHVSGVLHNARLYFSTAQDSVVTDGHHLAQWGVPAPNFDVEVTTGGSMEGRYRVAVTAVEGGVESGTTSLHVDLPPGGALRVLSADPRDLRVYVSAPNSATPYYQGPLIGGGQLYQAVYDRLETLTTDGLVPLPHCEAYCSYNGVIVGRSGNRLFFTEPAYPHLMDPVRGFFLYPSPISVLAPVEGGLYVVADKTYFITALETAGVSQVTRLDIGAVAGTECVLPDGTAYWMTPHGPALANAEEVKLTTRDTFSPQQAEYGASTYVETNGNEVVVTSMRGVLSTSALKSQDWAPHGDAT